MIIYSLVCITISTFYCVKISFDFSKNKYLEKYEPHPVNTFLFNLGFFSMFLLEKSEIIYYILINLI